MSDRERWIVYPILFFAVSLGLRNNGGFRGTVDFETIECSNLLVRSPDGLPKVQVDTNGSGGRVSVFGANNSRIFTVQGINAGESSQLQLVGSTGASVTIVAADQGSQANFGSGNLHPQVIVGRSVSDESYGLSAVQFGGASVATVDEMGVRFSEPSDASSGDPADDTVPEDTVPEDTQSDSGEAATESP